MPSDFTRSLADVLRNLGTASDTSSDVVAVKQDREAENLQHKHWFARFAAEQVMPLLNHTVEAIEKKGGTASCRLDDQNDRLAAELVIVPRDLPPGARAPRLTISAAPGERPLAIDYTGTFPFVGATGGFGAEIDYDTVYPTQIEEKILDFVALATGA